ncbi:MAG TPA: GDSL-type esterase/lipase family protein [Sedimentisphaerales bacterium]|jgi:lysophospholipase L1-like esterase|nr:GDSL-type esterase/lipase family protein [Sedimentisphaerales bacterium]HNU30484.1 GDSL-type esterase/lipase family protein [Sedimentisphaerales bacterium]
MKARGRSGSSRVFAEVVGWTCVILALLPLAAVHGQDPTRFESDIVAFEKADLTSPPPADPVLFVGSSSLRMWSDLAAAFPDYPVINRGFGGSHMSDLLYYFDRVVAVYKPALVVVYEGDNDLAGGKSVDQVYAEYMTFLSLVAEKLPGTEVAFIATKPSPSRAAYLEVTRQLNSRLQTLAAKAYHLWFMDVFTPMLGGDGQPRAELFLSDMLHMNADGYALWQAVVEPVLKDWSAHTGQTLLFDFGSSSTPTATGEAPNDPANAWNNVTETIGSVADGELPDLLNTQGASTGIGLKIVLPFSAGGPNSSGTQASTLFPANATRDSLYGNTEIWGGATNVFPSFKLVGLDPNRVYNVTLYASRTGASDVRETGYTVAGATSLYATLDAANNVDKTAQVVGAVPDAAGELTVSLAATANNNNANHFIYLGAMVVEEIPSQKPIVFSREPESQTVMECRPVTFEAAVDSTGPYFIQWFRDGDPIPGADEFSYTIESATLGMNGAVFSVSVGNLVYSDISAGAVLTVLADVNAPVLLAADSPDGLTIVLSFDERLKPEMATAVRNYTVNDGAVRVMVAALGEDGQTVTLTLSGRLLGVFSVSVSRLRDLAGNEIAAGAVATGEVRPEAFLFDFGSASTPTDPADDPDNVWNNVTDQIGSSSTGVLANLVTVRGTVTGASLVMISRFNGANTNGTLASTLFPADATRDSLYGNTELFGGSSNIFPSFKLTGLDAGLTYDFTFYASRLSVSDKRETGYTLVGADSHFAAFDGGNNVDGFVQAVGVAPDASGQITISIAPTAANNNSYHFTYLGVMKVEPQLPVEQ